MWYHRFFFYFKKRERDFEYQYNIQTPIRVYYYHLTHSENKLMKQIVRN